MSENPKLNIYITEDEELYSLMLEHNLRESFDFGIEVFNHGKKCLDRIKEKAPDVVILDYTLPDMKGDEMFQQIKTENPDIKVIILSGQIDQKKIIDLLCNGAYNYIVKEKDAFARLNNDLRNISSYFQLKQEVERLRAESVVSRKS